MTTVIGLGIDIVIVALLVIFGLIGLKKGFFKSILSIFSFGLCVTIAFFAAKHVAGWINALYDFSSLIGNKISNSLIKTNEFFAQSVNVYEAVGKDALIGAIPNNVNTLLTQIIKIIFSNNKVDMSSTDSIGSVIGLSLGNIAMIVITGILIFLILRIALALLTKLLDNASKTKVIGGLNKLLGFILGLIKGALIVCIGNIILVVATLLPPVNKLVNPIIQENSYVEKYVYNTTDNLFEKYVINGDLLKNVATNLWEKK